VTIVTKHDDHDDERKDNEYVMQLKENNLFCLSINTLKQKRLFDRKG
jgi:hypothetical protein